MSGQAIYRRWRPRRFADVVGQEHVTRTLRNAVKLDRVAHGYLFSGPRGVAKTSTARILAKAINCLNPQDGEPCDACDLCRSIAEGTSYDVLEMDAASNGLVDNVRDLRQHVLTHPDQARRKVYILDEAHRMSAPAFDALLKTLEEPPEHVVFILVTSEADKIPATIVSRCQRFDFRRLPQRGIVGRLKEICDADGVEVAPAGLDLIARAATGSMRDAQSLLDQLFALGTPQVGLEDVEAILGTAGTTAARDLASHVIRRDQAAGLRLISAAVAEGADPKQFCRDTTEYLRGLLLLKLGGPDEALDLSPETIAEMQALAGEASAEQLLRATKLFGQAEVGWRGTLHFQLPLELAFVEATLDPPAAQPEPAAAPPVARPAAPVPAAPGIRPPLPRPTPRPPLGGSVGASAPAAGRPTGVGPLTGDAATAVGAGETIQAGAGLAAGSAGTTSVTTAASAAMGTAASGAQAGAASTEAASAASAAAEAGDGGAPAAGASPAVDIKDVRARWQAVRRAVGTVSKPLEALLNDVRPARISGAKVILEARSPFHRGEVSRPKNSEILETELERAFGQRLRVDCVVADTWERSDDEPPDPFDDPLVRMAVKREWRPRLVEPGGGTDSVQ